MGEITPPFSNIASTTPRNVKENKFYLKEKKNQLQPFTLKNKKYRMIGENYRNINLNFCTNHYAKTKHQHYAKTLQFQHYAKTKHSLKK